MFWTRVLALTLGVSAPSTTPTTTTPATIPAARAEAAAPGAEAAADTSGDAKEPGGKGGPSACPTVTHVGLEIEGEQLGEGSELLLERVRRRLQSTLRQWDIRPAREASHPVLTVRLSRLPDYAGYDLQFSGRRDGEELPEVAGSAECRICTEDEFVEHVGETFERMLSRLIPAPVVNATPPAPAVSRRNATPSPAPVVVRPLPEDPDLLRLRRAGVGLGIGGSVLIGAGVGIAILQPILLTDGVAEARQLWVPGTVMAVAGATALVSGIVLLAVENRRRRARVPATPGLAHLEWAARMP